VGLIGYYHKFMEDFSKMVTRFMQVTHRQSNFYMN